MVQIYDSTQIGRARHDSDTFTEVPLFLGDDPDVWTDPESVSGAADIAARVVVSRQGDKTVAPSVYGDGKKLVGVTAAPYVHGITGATIAKTPVYKGGYFNLDALVFDASFDTLDKKLSLFMDVPNFRVGQISSPDH